MSEALPPDGLDRWIDRTEKRLSRTERLGPLTDPDIASGTAVEVEDWSSDETSINGWFWSDYGARNTPEDGYRWIGTVVASDDSLNGVQKLFTLDDYETPREFSRRWVDYDDGSTRYYSDWVQTNAGEPNIVTGDSSGLGSVSITSTTNGPGTSKASLDYAVAIGRESWAAGNLSVAIGSGAYAALDQASALGQNASATAAHATAVGVGATASGSQATALGSDASASGDWGVAIGPNSYIGTSSGQSIAIGYGAQDLGTGSNIVIGNGARGNGFKGITIGFADADGNRSISIGDTGGARAHNSIAVGYGAIAGGGLPSATPLTDAQSAIAIGEDAYAGSPYSIAIGNNAFAENTASGGGSYELAIGRNTSANKPGTVALGTDHTGAGAQATDQDDFVLGTANHKVQVPGRLNVARRTPTGTADTQGAVGDITSDDSYLYAKTSTGWKRAALSTF